MQGGRSYLFDSFGKSQLIGPIAIDPRNPVKVTLEFDFANPAFPEMLKDWSIVAYASKPTEGQNVLAWKHDTHPQKVKDTDWP